MKTKLRFVIVAAAVIINGFQKSNAQNTSPYWSLAGNSNATSTSKLGTTNAINLRLLTNNLERMRITTSGLVGIGTTNPTDRLHINSASGANALRAQVNGSTKLLVHSGGGVSVGSSSTPPANGLYVSGNVGIGISSPSYKLDVEGVIHGKTYSSFAGVIGEGNYGIMGISNAPDNSLTAYGVRGVGPNGVIGIGSSSSGNGVYGSGQTGVYGISTNYDGGHFESYNGYGLSASTTYGAYAAVFYGDVYTAGTVYQTSDKNLKKNIKDFGNAMSIINKLKPKNYEFRNDGKYASLNLPKGSYYGLLAQDVEEVLPKLVKESSHELRTVKPITSIKPGADGKQLTPVAEQKETKESINIKGVNYMELIPIVIKGMQEQEAKIHQQDAKIDEQNDLIEKQNGKIYALTELVNKLLQSSNTPSVKLSGASLGPCTPNPNSISTRINYSIPTSSTRAELIISNNLGQKIKQIRLNNSGLVNMDTSALSAGTYFYTMYVDGQPIDTKKMIIYR